MSRNTIPRRFMFRRGRTALGSTVALAAVMAVVLLLSGFGQSAAEARGYGRISYIAGDLMLRGERDDDWAFARVNTTVRDGDALWTNEDGLAEIEMGEDTFLRMGYGSSITLYQFPPNAEWGLQGGSAYVDWSRRDGRLFLTTPTADVYVRKSALLRVDVADDGSTRVTVRRGEVKVAASGQAPKEVERGWRVYVYPARGPTDWERLGRVEEDSFDEFNEAREEYYAAYEPPRYVRRSIVGIYDLPRYGAWVEIGSDYYWRPRARHWQPYRHGRWGFVFGYGRTWIDDYPWGYATGHYGRWLWTRRYGWVWKPGYVWGPGYVYWGRFDDYVCWTPLDPYDRPVHVSFGISIPIGDHGYFSLWAGSYAPYSYFGGPYVRPHPFDHHVTNIVQHNNITIINNNTTIINNGDVVNSDTTVVNILRPRKRLRGPLVRDAGVKAAVLVRKLKTSEDMRGKHWGWRSKLRERARLVSASHQARPHVAHEAQGPGSRPPFVRAGAGKTGAVERIKPKRRPRPLLAEAQNPDREETSKPRLRPPLLRPGAGKPEAADRTRPTLRPPLVRPGAKPEVREHARPTPSPRPKLKPADDSKPETPGKPTLRPRPTWKPSGGSGAEGPSKPTLRPRPNWPGPHKAGGDEPKKPTLRPRPTWKPSGRSGAEGPSRPTVRPKWPGPSGNAPEKLNRPSATAIRPRPAWRPASRGSETGPRQPTVRAKPGTPARPLARPAAPSAFDAKPTPRHKATWGRPETPRPAKPSFARPTAGRYAPPRTTSRWSTPRKPLRSSPRSGRRLSGSDEHKRSARSGRSAESSSPGKVKSSSSSKKSGKRSLSRLHSRLGRGRK